MKRNIILFAGLALSACAFSQQNDPVLMRINNKDITRSEFEYIYNKNSSNKGLEKKSLDEYVNLFVNFKLKVTAAQAEGLDTTRVFFDEFLGYRQQLAKTYLTDESVDEQNAHLYYNRLKENVEASHILIKCKPDASPADSLLAFQKAEKARRRILNGEHFDKVAREMSDDPSAKSNGGNLGYFTALQMVAPFEDAAYSLKKGEVSNPIRTDFGYHIIKVSNRRDDIGKVKVAHIFKSLRQDVSKEQESKALAQMDSIYTALNSGSNFSDLAKQCSDDQSTAPQGGELPWIGFRQTVKEFEQVAFSLNKDEYSKPFRSPSGIHILKLIDRKTSDSFEEKKDEIIRRMNRQGRGEKGVEALVEKLKKEYAFQFDEKNLASVKSLIKNIQAGKDSLTSNRTKSLTGSLFVLSGVNYSVSDFIEWTKTNNASVDKLLNKYVQKSVLAYEDTQLEKKYPDFRYLMQEYKDGIVLFEISNRFVWEKSSKDEQGLEQYFQDNRSNYKWEIPRFRGVIVHCKDKKIAKAVTKLLKNTPEDNWMEILNKEFNKDANSTIKVEKGLYAKGENKYVDKLQFKSGAFDALPQYPVTIVIGKKLNEGPEALKDVRGVVTADYQNFLESNWIKDLRDKYKVEINQEVLKTVNNHSTN